MRRFALFAMTVMSAVLFASAMTSITVSSEYKKEINVKIQGTGIGGCDIILMPGETNTANCDCLWGTLNYSFCAYSKGATAYGAAGNATEEAVGSGRCPKVTGESLVCSDLESLGNCYGKGYSCLIDATGLCHCSSN